MIATLFHVMVYIKEAEAEAMPKAFAVVVAMFVIYFTTFLYQS